MNNDVTICIPAYKSAGFVHEAIESVLAQTYRDIRILISVDPAGDGTEEVCRQYCGDPRVELVINRERLGWVGNSNACLDRIDTPFFMMCFHDDRLHPEFVAKTRQILLNEPDVVAAFSYLQRTGKRNELENGPNLDGTALERLFELHKVPAAYSFKNLMRSDLVRGGLRMWEGPGGGYRADFRTILAYCLSGKMKCVPEVLYFKHFWDDSTTQQWRRMPNDVLVEAEAASLHAQMDVIANSNLSTIDKRRALSHVLARRPLGLTHGEDLTAVAIDDFDRARNVSLMSRLLGFHTSDDVAPELPASARTYAARQEVIAGRKLIRSGQLEASVRHSRAALSLDPLSAKAHILLARKSLRQGARKPADLIAVACEHAERAIELAPEDPEAWEVLANAKKRSGQLMEAIGFLDKALKFNPGNADQLRQVLNSWTEVGDDL